MKKLFAIIFGALMFFSTSSYAELNAKSAENFIKKVIMGIQNGYIQ